MNRIVPWAELVAIIEPYAPKPGPKGGRPPFAVQTLLRIHCLQQWLNLSDPAMEEALYDAPLMREFAGIDIGVDVVPDESTSLRFRHLLEAHDLQRAIFERINALLREQSQMLQEGTVVATAANVHDVTQAHHLLHGSEADVWADAGYRGVDKRDETKDLTVRWHVAMRPGQRRALDKSTLLGQVKAALEHVKARIRATGEHPFYVIERLFGFAKCPYRGLKKNAAKLTMCAALANLYMARRQLLMLSTG